ncbi:MAG: GDSL-type esterase/lipase family protein [Spirochaetota bacterium]
MKKRFLAFACILTALPVFGADIKGRFVRLALTGNYIHIAELEVMSGNVNVALKKPATQSSVYGGAGPERVVDGNTNGNWQGASVNSTKNGDEWLEVDLGAASVIDAIVIYNRTDHADIGMPRIIGASVTVLDENRALVWQGTIKEPKALYRFEPGATPMEKPLVIDDLTLAVPTAIERIAFHGDSITFGGNASSRERSWPMLFKIMLEKKYTVSAMTNLAKPGTGAIAQRGSGETIAAFTPDLVCIMLGLNDMRKATPLDEYRSALESIVAAVRRSSPKALVMLGGPTWIEHYTVWTADGKPYANGVYDKGSRELHLAYREAVKAAAEKYKCAFVDVYAVMEGKPELLPDRTHPNDQGHEVIANCYIAAFRSLVDGSR